MQNQGQWSNDLAEVYAYADSIGVTPQQVDAAIGNNTSLRERLIAWKYLLHSLVNTGYTPWLQGDGVAYINTGVIPKTNSTITFRIKPTSFTQLVMGARNDTSDKSSSYMIVIRNTSIRGDWFGNSASLNSSAITYNDICTVSAGVVYINGVLDKSYSITKTVCNYPMYLFLGNTNSVVNTSNVFTGAINHVILDGTINGIDGSRHFVPYCDNGTYGMLDLVSNTFFGSAAQNGLFSYELLDSNNNVVNIN